MTLSSQNKARIWKLSIVAILLVGAFATGRYTLPAKVVTVTETKVETQYVDKVQYVDKIQTVYVHDVVKDVHQVTVVEKKPDGTETTTVTMDDKSKSETSASSQEVVTKTEDKTKDTESDAKTSKVVENGKAQWHLRVDAGAGARFVGQMTPTLVLGVGVERRIIGPFFAGIWVQTTLNLLAPQTPPYGVNGGISLGAEF